MNETQLAVVESADAVAESEIAATPWITRIEDHLAWPVLAQMPVMLTVRIGLNRLKIRDLLKLDKGQVLESTWSQTGDVPVAVGEVRLCWGEFEVSGQQIGVRLTHLL